MTILKPIRDESVAFYLDAVFASVSGGAAITPQREKQLLMQTVAICETQLDLAPTFPLPDDAQILPALVRAIADMRSVLYPHDQGELDKALHSNRLWDVTCEYAVQRLAALESLTTLQG